MLCCPEKYGVPDEFLKQRLGGIFNTILGVGMWMWMNIEEYSFTVSNVKIISHWFLQGSICLALASSCMLNYNHALRTQQTYTFKSARELH